MASPRLPRRWKRWLIGAIALVLLVVVGGPFIYFHFIEGSSPAKLTLSHTKAKAAAGVALAGTWDVVTGSEAGYRVEETLFGQSHTAVGRTTAVTGQMTISGNQVTSTAVTVDLTKVSSDSGQRDGLFRGRIMNTSQYPTAMFTLATPINLGTVPTPGTTINVSASGSLRMHGATRTVQVAIQARQSGNVVQVSGSVPITFADYNINNPSGGPASTGDTGTMEFLITFQHV